MTVARQFLDLGLDTLPAARAQRVRLFRLILADAALLRGRMDGELAPSGITTRQAALLQFVETRSEPPRVSEVAAGMTMTHQNVKQIALALEKKGFLVIEQDPLDGRARRLRVTDTHRRFWAKRNPDDFASVEHWTAALSESEVDKLVSLLKRLHRSLSEPSGQG